jgi:polyisoprenyl-phosphate glycosyltransferase
MAKLSIIVPCYYNADNIPELTRTLFSEEPNFPGPVSFEYIFVDDGSKDGTYQALLDVHHKHPTKVKLIRLARNFGTSNAVLAGLNHATGDVFTIISADLQDPPSLLVQMYTHWKNGIKLIVANREVREEPMMQRLLSNTFHYLMRRFALPNTPPGGFDLVMYDRQIRDLIVKMDERNAHLPYVYLWLGFDYVNIPYRRRKREIGTSKWTLQKKIKSMIDCFVAFSFVPIQSLAIMGIISGLIALGLGIYLIVQKYYGNIPVEGWTSLMVVMLLVSSFQMMGLGILGEYIWRGLDSARRRPNFVIDEIQDSQVNAETKIRAQS